MALGDQKAAALPGFHAPSGCDSTESLTGKGKLSFWKAFTNAPISTIEALAQLGSTAGLYQNDSKATTLASLRWMMFKTKQALSEKLPPTRGALLPALKRANFQALI